MLKYVVILMCLCGCATKQRFDRTKLEFTGGAVAADHELASQVGVEILRIKVGTQLMRSLQQVLH